MKTFFERGVRLLELPLDLGPRGLLLVATLLLAPAYLTPLWKLTMFAPQYPDGLRMEIYSYKLEGGNGGQDVKEINVLNHYIGMRELTASEFTEFKWIPFVVGALGLLFLRAAAIGRMGTVVDVLVIYVYFGLFSLWSFAYKLYTYGHNLDPSAPIHMDPFTPAILGTKQIANFTASSYPRAATFLIGGFATAVLLIAILHLLRPPQRRTAPG